MNNKMAVVKKMFAYQQVADRLNKKGILPFSARQWSSGLVQQAVYGKVNYPEVTLELRELMNEYYEEGKS
jgi:hypothetical protein